jgi:hypothetical protein
VKCRVMRNERDVLNATLYHRAIRKRIGEALSARHDLSEPLPDKLRTPHRRPNPKSPRHRVALRLESPEPSLSNATPLILPPRLDRPPPLTARLAAAAICRAITRNFPHGGYRHSNVTMLVPPSSGTIVASRIDDVHAIHRTEYWMSIVALLAPFRCWQLNPQAGPLVCASLLTLMAYPPSFGGRIGLTRINLGGGALQVDDLGIRKPPIPDTFPRTCTVLIRLTFQPPATRQHTTA